MKKQILLVIASFCCILSYGQKEEKTVHEIVIAQDAALVSKDSVKLNQLLSADFIGTIPSGKYFQKADYIKHHCKPNVGLMSLKPKESTNDFIRIYERTAVVNRTVSAKIKKPDGSTYEFDVQRIEVLNKKGDQWYLISGQGTEVNLALRP